MAPMRIADLIMPGATEGTTVRYIAESSFTNLAAAFAENGALAEQQWDYAEVDAAVEGIGLRRALVRAAPCDRDRRSRCWREKEQSS